MRSLLSAALIGAALAALPATAQEPVDRAMLARIKDEGLQRSRAQELYFALTDGIGARLTGSPSHVQAARWAQARFTEFGLANARLEPFAFPRGWSLEKISVEMTVPRYMPLIAYAEAWTPSPAGLSAVASCTSGIRALPKWRPWQNNCAAPSCSQPFLRRNFSMPIVRSRDCRINRFGPEIQLQRRYAAPLLSPNFDRSCNAPEPP